MDLTISVKE